MGLDIHISTDNSIEFEMPDFFDEEDGYHRKYSLSRAFCNLMCRRNVINHEPELDQIGKLTGVDISPLYEMENYPDENHLEYQLESAESKEEKQLLLAQAETDKTQLQDNINKVLQTINALIEKVKLIADLPALFLPTNFEVFNLYYFIDFEADKGNGYIDNNFGQDLRNFKRFLEFAQENGVTTVWFLYG